MQTKTAIKKRLAMVLADERLSYKTATVFENAPLALIQLHLKTERDLLRWVLKEEIT